MPLILRGKSIDIFRIGIKSGCLNYEGYCFNLKPLKSVYISISTDDKPSQKDTAILFYSFDFQIQ